jgi:PAS domain-containing protein
VLTTGQPFEKEVRDRFGNWHLLRILPYQSKSQVEGVVVTLIDIESLKAAQSDLRDKDQQLQGILDNSPSFIFVKDLEGRYLLANGQSKSVLRAESESVVGKTDHDFLPQSVADRMETQDRHVATTGESTEIEQSMPHGRKSRVYLSVIW